MASGWFYTIESGAKKMIRAIASSAGASDANKIPRLDSTGKLSQTMMPAGVVPDTETIEATEDLSAGNYVNIFNDGGTGKCRLADRTNSRPAHGFVKEGVTSGNDATVYFEGNNAHLLGMTPGVEQFLGTNGGVSETAPEEGSGHICQALGVARSATSMNFERQREIDMGTSS